MKRAVLLIIVLIFITFIHAATPNFVVEKIEMKIGSIQKDGSAHVQESIRFILYGDYANSIYDGGLSSNDLSSWANITDSKEVKFHVNNGIVSIQDFRLRPQPRTQCNPIQGTCHGELILDYLAEPINTNATSLPIQGTGLFSVKQYKPRTDRYTFNSKALSFTTTPDGNTILANNVFLVINLPPQGIIDDVNPQPTTYNTQYQVPQGTGILAWSDVVLVKFSVVFEVEGSIQTEVSEFFSNIGTKIYDLVSGPNGAALIIMIIVLIGSYAYITRSKRKNNE